MNQPKHLISSARRLRKRMTDAEWALWNMLRDTQCEFKFRRQHPIEPYVVDFYCAERKLIIEADGGQHGEANDKVRDETLKKMGYRILRFWNNDILTNRDGVWAVIARALNGEVVSDVISPTLPSPLQGEESCGTLASSQQT